MMNEEEKCRIDKWLWAARFYKTRALAREAVKGGKVHANNERVKPSRNINIGDTLSITRNELTYIIVVEGINHQRRPAKEAQLLYRETPESIEQREKMREVMKLASAATHYGDKRPSKKQRRSIVRFKRENAE